MGGLGHAEAEVLLLPVILELVNVVIRLTFILVFG